MENFILIGVFVLLGILLRRTEAFPKDSAQVLNMFALFECVETVAILPK